MELAWYINRLRVMDARELAHRIRERLNLRVLERSQYSAAIAAPVHSHDAFAFCSASKPVLPKLHWDISANNALAEGLLEGHWAALGYAWQFTNSPSCWHCAPDTGAIWPDSYFGRIAYRHGNPFGDARVVWEPSRLQQLVSLALLAGRPHRRERAVVMIERQLASWVAANPPYRGVHYVSAMECALRMIAVCHAVDMVRGCLSDRRATWRCVVTLVASHATLIQRRLSLHSSSSNHTIAEAVGLIYAGVLFPELKHAQTWRDTGRTVLRTQYQRQVLVDGGGAEQAPAYLKLITELAGLAQGLLATQSLQDAATVARIKSSRRCLDEFGTETIGDSDSGHALSPFLRAGPEPKRPPRPRVMLPASGYTILRSRAPHEHQVVFDHGPLGMAPMHAHGHADALSITVRRGNLDLLVDPGTYSYSDVEWRRHFRSTRAHNTVTVDDRDQADQVAPFLWRNPYQCKRIRCDGGDHTLLLATHDGYQRLGVNHWRGVVYDHASRLVVWDHLEGHETHRLSLWWHFGVEASLADNVVSANDGTLALAVQGATRQTAYCGSTNPIAGWRSPRYGVKHPSASIESTYEGEPPHEFITTIHFGGDVAALRPDARELEHLATLRRWVREA